MDDPGFLKLLITFSTVTDVCIFKERDSRITFCKKECFFGNLLFFVLFSQFHEAPTMLGLTNF